MTKPGAKKNVSAIAALEHANTKAGNELSALTVTVDELEKNGDAYAAFKVRQCANELAKFMLQTKRVREELARR